MYKKLNNYFVACYSNNYSYNYVFVELIEGTSVLQVCLSMYLGKISSIRHKRMAFGITSI